VNKRLQAVFVIKDHPAAAKALASALEVSERLNESIRAVMAQGVSGDELRDYKRAVGAVMAELMFKILNPIIAEHPDLAPEGWPDSSPN
jgi:hypothetical protein